MSLRPEPPAGSTYENSYSAGHRIYYLRGGKWRSAEIESRGTSEHRYTVECPAHSWLLISAHAILKGQRSRERGVLPQYGYKQHSKSPSKQLKGATMSMPVRRVTTMPVRTPEARGTPSLRDRLLQHYKQNENWEEKNFLCVAAIKMMLTEVEITNWVIDHPLHSPSDKNLDPRAHDVDLIKSILERSRLLFGVLVLAELEYLTSSFHSKGLNDNSFPDTDLNSLNLTSQEQRRLSEFCNGISPVFSKDRHLELSLKSVLPFIRRRYTSLSVSLNGIYEVEVADGHLEGCDRIEVAEKEIPVNGQALDHVFREVQTLRERKHPNIVPLLASYTLEKRESDDDVTLHLLFPLADRNVENLAKWMVLPQPPTWIQEEKLKTAERRSYVYRTIYELVSSLSFLHRERAGLVTAHHDLKPSNILVFGKELKIADLGRSHLRPVGMGSQTVASDGLGLGTYEYQPPEYWNNNGQRSEMKHGRAFDIWSMGCIIIELATLVVYGWKTRKVSEFRIKRQENPHKDRPLLAKSRQPLPDNSFHNNTTVVKAWMEQLKIDDNSQKLKSIIDLAEQMLRPKPADRLYSWEAELDLYKTQSPDDDRVQRLEKEALLVQPPRKEKSLHGTQTPVHRAILMEDYDRFVQLCKVGWPQYVRDSNGLTPWDLIDQSKNSSFCAAVRRSQNIEQPSKAAYNINGLRLLEAAKKGQPDQVRSLLTQGVSAMVYDEKGRSALYFAAQNNHTSIIAPMLQSGADQLLRQKEFDWGDTPLHKAASLGHANVARQLLAYSPNIEDRQKEGKTALILAVEWGQYGVVQVLLDHGARTSTRRDTRGNALHAAARCGESKVLQLLVKADDINDSLETKNRTGDTPLWLAVCCGHLQCAAILLDAGASLHAANNDGVNLIHVAVDRQFYDFLEENLRKFARPEIEARNRWNETPLMLARRHNRPRFIKILEDFGARF